MAAAGLAPAVASAESKAKVVIVGGGFAGATCARYLKKIDPEIEVTLVEPEATYVACPLSSEVVAGLRDAGAQQFAYAAVARAGVRIAPLAARSVDAVARTVVLENGVSLAWDRLVLAPGIDVDWKGLPGYDPQAAETLPHAWNGGQQIALLRRQLEAMEDGGLVVVAVPEGPIRCAPAPYERASLIAFYLKNYKTRSKLLILDAKDSFSQQRLFQKAWRELYPGLLEWVPLSQAGKVTAVEANSRTFKTDFESHKAAVGNVIPPQKAGAIAASAGVADRTGWCPVEPVSFESSLQAGIHVLGDAAIMSGMAKSAFIAQEAARVCGAAISARLRGKEPAERQLGNTCFSIVAPHYGFSMKHLYRPRAGQLAEVPNSASTSSEDADPSTRAEEVRLAQAWFQAATAEMFA